MSRFETILVPYDFSPHAEAALDVAIEMAQALGARVHLIHVYPSPERTLAPYGDLLPPTVLEEIGRSATERLQAPLARAREAGVAGEADAQSGSPAEAIVAAASALPAQLIVMGTRGLTGLRHVLLGSVAERTLHTAPCPVLTMRAEEND